MKWMMALILATASAFLSVSDLGAQVATNLTGTWQLNALTDSASVSGPSAGLVKTAYTGNLVLTHDGSYTFTGTWTMDGQTGTLSNGSISDIYVGFMVSGYKLGGTMPTTSFYFNGSLNAALDTITGTFNGFAEDGTRWGGSFKLTSPKTEVNLPPTISVFPDPTGKTFFVGEWVDVMITATDPNPDVVTLTPSPMPPGLSFTSSPGNPAVGRIFGTLTAVGIFPVTITASDSGVPMLTAFASLRFVVCALDAKIPECLSMTYQLERSKVLDRDLKRIDVKIIGADEAIHLVTAMLPMDGNVSLFSNAADVKNNRPTYVMFRQGRCGETVHFDIWPVKPAIEPVMMQLFLDQKGPVVASAVGVVGYYPRVDFPPVLITPPAVVFPNRVVASQWGPDRPEGNSVNGRGLRLDIHERVIAGPLPYSAVMTISPSANLDDNSDLHCANTEVAYDMLLEEPYDLGIESRSAAAVFGSDVDAQSSIGLGLPLTGVVVHDELRVFESGRHGVTHPNGGPFTWLLPNGNPTGGRPRTRQWSLHMFVAPAYGAPSPAPDWITLSWAGRLQVSSLDLRLGYVDAWLLVPSFQMTFRLFTDSE